MLKKMKLSVETHILRDRFGDEAAVKMIKEAGFDAFDYSFYWTNEKTDMLGNDYREKALKIRRLADEVGIECNQAHAPFDFGYNDAMDESNKNFLRLVRSIEAAAILGAKNIIVHSIKPRSLTEDIDFYEYNRRYYTSLIPYCEKYGICVSVENLFNENIPVLGDPDEMRDFVKSLNSKYFNICIDIGHLGKTGLVPEAVIKKTDPDMLMALHVQDNDLKRDRHWLPYCGELNWTEITRSLGEIGYRGDLTFEIFGYLGKQESKNLPAALRFAEQTGRLLIEKILNYRKAE